MPKRALKVTMVVFGGILSVEGLLDVAIPAQRSVGLGLEQCAQQARLALGILGVSWLAIGGWIIAAARDPLRHLNWVKFCLAFPLLLLAVLVISAVRGAVKLDQVAIDIAFDALFAVLFIAFYPRAAHLSSSQ